MPRSGLPGCLALILAFAEAGAQTKPPPAASLPDPNRVPTMPPDLRLPGPDPRQCEGTKWSALCAEGRWTQYSRISLRVSAPQFSAHYEIEQAANGEQHTTYREKFASDERRGELVIFGMEGFTYRSKDKFPESGSSIIDHMVSSPIMLSQLATLLLDQGALVSPAEVTSPRTIRAENATQYIRTAAPRVAALYGPPWSMTGSVRPAGRNELAFTLRLRYRPVDARGALVAGKTDAVTLEGTVSYAPRRPTLPDSFDLVGWTVMKRDSPVPAVSNLAQARESAGM